MSVVDSTINRDEVAFYTRLADQWWNTSGPFWPLHKLNELRVAYIRGSLCKHFGTDPQADLPLAGLSVLDIGCGGGILSESMAQLGASVTGIDVVEKNIAVARLHARRACLAIDYQLITARELADSGARFDVVLNIVALILVTQIGKAYSKNYSQKRLSTGGFSNTQRPTQRTSRMSDQFVSVKG